MDSGPPDPPAGRDGDPNYVWAVRLGTRVTVSGAGPVAAEGETVPDSVGAQTRRCCEVALAAADRFGVRPADVISVRAFVVRRMDREAVRQAATEYFGDHRPAISVDTVGNLPVTGWKVELELEAMARRDDER